MNESKRKRQHLQQLERQENDDKDNHSIAGASSELSFNCGKDDKNTIGNDGNELREMKLKMAALESKIALLEAKNQNLEGKLANQQELNAKMHVLAEENKTLVEKLKESEQKAQMVKNELEEINQSCRQKLEKLTSEIANFKEQEQKAINLKPETTTKDSPCLRLLPLETWTEMLGRSGQNSPSNSHPHHGGPHTLYQYQHRIEQKPPVLSSAGRRKSQNNSPPLNGFGTAESKKIGENRKRGTSKGVRLSTTGLFRIDSTSTCQCHDRDYPPWTGEIHGMSQALLSKSLPLRVFWWMVLVLCTSCGTATTVCVIIEYIQGPTATSTTIRLVPSLELPAITVCPKVPDAFNFDAMYNDMRTTMADLDRETARDIVSFWVGGSGLENMDGLPDFNQSRLEHLAQLFERWRQGTDTKTFFHTIHVAKSVIRNFPKKN